MGAAGARIIGRYAVLDEIAAGGMATVHIGRLVGEVGFSRIVAIKRLHNQLARVPDFVAMLVDEARLASRIRHPNVVPTLDTVKTEDELFLVMEYVHGESLHSLLKRCRRTKRVAPTRYVVPIIAGALHGLHAAHEAKGEGGAPLGIVHRDVSPQNILVGTDGVPRVFDFGIAKAYGRLQVTQTGHLKGKLPYMAPEQLSGKPVDRRVDVYATSIVLWEALAGRRLFRGEFEAEVLAQVLAGAKQPPSAFCPDVPPELDALVMRGLASRAEDRFSTAREMAYALEHAVHCASPAEVGEWVETEGGESLARRAARIEEIESLPVSAIQTAVAPNAALGRYELVAELHKGYLGPLWAGRPQGSASLDDTLLIRLISLQPGSSPEAPHPAAIQALMESAPTPAPLRHELLVPVVDTVVTDGELGLVSPYVEGETLRSLTWLAGIRRTPLPPAAALRIALDLLEALDHLHTQPFRGSAVGSSVGLTADDVVVCTDGRARLLEPGVAGVVASLEPWARHPRRACYDAPERLRRGARLDLRADLFTVGVMLWEMLQNRTLFTGSSLSEVAQGIISGVIEQVVPEAPAQRPEIAQALAAVVGRALERDETLRFQSAPEMAVAIASTGHPVASPSELGELLNRFAGGSLTTQRQRIRGEPPPSVASSPSGRWSNSSATPISQQWSSSTGSARFSASFPGAPPSSPAVSSRRISNDSATWPSVAAPPPSSRAPGGGVPPAAPGGEPAGFGEATMALGLSTEQFVATPPGVAPPVDPDGPTLARSQAAVGGSGGFGTPAPSAQPFAASMLEPQPARRSRLPLVAVIGVLLLAAIAGVVGLVVLPGADAQPPASAVSVASPTSEPTPTVEPDEVTSPPPTAVVEASASATASAEPSSAHASRPSAPSRPPKTRPTAAKPTSTPTATAKPPDDERYVPSRI